MQTYETASRAESYLRMDEGTPEQYALAKTLNKPYKQATAKRILQHMQLLKRSMFGGQLDRYDHSLQTATRAHDAGECEEIVVAALLHDIGDMLAPENHADLAADILRPYVSRHTFWMIKMHAVFQGYYYWDKVGKDKDERERYRDHPAFEMTERFCGEYDQVAFDPDYPTMTIEDFEPMVRRIFSRQAWGEHTQQDWPVV